MRSRDSSTEKTTYVSPRITRQQAKNPFETAVAGVGPCYVQRDARPRRVDPCCAEHVPLAQMAKNEVEDVLHGQGVVHIVRAAVGSRYDGGGD